MSENFVDQLLMAQNMQRGQGTGGSTAASNPFSGNFSGPLGGGPEGFIKGEIAQGLESLQENSRLGKAPGLKVPLQLLELTKYQAQALTIPTGQFNQAITPPPSPINAVLTGKVASVFSSRKK